ncbi:hypothetical protein PO609_11280 [Enterobacter cloacae]
MNKRPDTVLASDIDVNRGKPEVAHFVEWLDEEVAAWWQLT